MATTAYELERFASSEKKKPIVRVARGSRTARAERGMRAMGNLLMVAIVVVLTVGVLHTNMRVNEVTGQIADQKSELAEQEALYTYLENELNSASNIKAIEEKAKLLGMVKMSKNQVVYVQVEDEESIQVQENSLAKFGERAAGGLLNVIDYFDP